MDDNKPRWRTEQLPPDTDALVVIPDLDGVEQRYIVYSDNRGDLFLDNGDSLGWQVDSISKWIPMSEIEEMLADG